MNRPFRTGLVAGLLALVLVGAACGSTRPGPSRSRARSRHAPSARRPPPRPPRGLAKLTGQAMAPTVVSAAWKNMRFTVDPLSSTLKKEAADAKAAGLLDSSVKLDGIYDLDLLNQLLTAAGKEPVKD
jgi:hypothetical protein